MKVRLLALLSLCAVAVPAFGRVLSYAPYTNRYATVSIHERTGRWFALTERPEQPSYWGLPPGEVVLYDTRDEEEPRVVYPSSGLAFIQFVAVAEPSFAPKPLLLVGANEPVPGGMNQTVVLLSADGGNSWKKLPELGGSWIAGNTEVDFGGPMSTGMTAQVVVGNAQYPFVLATSKGVHAIAADGTVKALLLGSSIMVGRNRAATEFLVNRNGYIEILDLSGNYMGLVRADPNASYSGWLAADESVYLQMIRPEGRFLFLGRGQSFALVAGPRGVTPPSIGTPPAWGAETIRFFAVPTHDYEGAWMIQRDPAKPTTLLRHTLARGTEEVWSDPLGPEVEALIAGRSGETLLVQVHRERQARAGMIVDPAIAVWRTGEGAPKEYDELYLDEQFNKGFVHVDPDRIEDGTPFVFDSGAEQPLVDIIVSPAPGGGDVIQEWGVVRASLRQHLVLPGVARTRGAYDSNWFTDITVGNPLDQPQDVTLKFVSSGSSFEAAAQATVTVPLAARQTRVFRDVLGSVFGLADASGTLHVVPASGATVTSRTYSRKGEGTYGFGMLGIDYFNSVGPRFPLTFAGAFPGGHFRTNVLLTDTSGRGSEASLQAFGVTGPIGASHLTVSTSPLGTSQTNGVGGLLGLGSQESGGLMFAPVRGTSVATVVAMDNRTNDPTWFPPDLPASVARGIPVISHTDGAHGAKFRSDVYLFNPADEVRSVTLEAKDWTSATVKRLDVILQPREGRLVPDALKSLFGMEGVARLQYWSREAVDGVRVTSRSYTEEESGATYGSLVPPMNGFQLAVPGDTLEIHGVIGGGGFRTNLGLVEYSAVSATAQTAVRVRVLNDHYQQIDSFEVTLPPAAGMQINDLFALRHVPMPDAAVILVDALSGGTVAAYASLVDNVTNDSTYLAAQLGARP